MTGYKFASELRLLYILLYGGIVLIGAKTLSLPNNGDFYDLVVTSSNIFVDKTRMIEEYLKKPSAMFLIIRPSKWGKTTNVDMLKRFLEIEVDDRGVAVPLEKRINYPLFAGGKTNDKAGFNNILFKPLKISDSPSDCMRKQGQYPVIYLSFKDVQGNSTDDIEAGIRKEIKRILERQHNYLYRYVDNDDDKSESDCDEVLTDADRRKLKRYFIGEYGSDSLKEFPEFLARVLYAHYQKKNRVHVFIDDYDVAICKLFAVILKGYRVEYKRLPEYLIYEKTVQSTEFVNAHRLIATMFALLKDSYAVEKTLISGVLHLNDLLCDVQNISSYSVLDKDFSAAYGFTEEELDGLLCDNNKSLTNDTLVRKWYRGYHVYDGRIVYNPWSIHNYVAAGGIIDYYWSSDVASNMLPPLIDDLLSKDDYTKSQLRRLMKGETIDEYIRKGIAFNDIRFDGLIHILLFGGYLTATPNINWKFDYTYLHPCQLKIPNLEVNFIYEDKILPPDMTHFDQ